MKRTLLIVSALIGGVAALSLVWRWLSTHRSFPCPSLLGEWMRSDLTLAPGILGSAAVVAHARIEPGMRVLDVGCGPGRVTIPAAQRVGSDGGVVAVDIQGDMIGQLRSLIQQYGLRNVETLVADVSTQSLEAGDFDRALLVTVLGETTDRESTLRTIHHTLRPGGILSVTEMLTDPHYQRRTAVVDLALSAGFALREQFGGAFAYTLNFEKRGEQ